ncbi:MAG: hypothetical protein J1F37_04260 [Oscillospiraceae bacterium]|nr:hypothetical protein [Oscillospiraceae bacterium]
MSNIKKVIGIVLALVMVLSMASVAFAADGDYYEISFNVVDDKTTLAPGESTTIEVKLTANYYVSAISIPIFFDNSNVDVEATTELENAKIADETAPDVAKFYESVEHTPETAALRALVYIAPYYSEIKEYNNETVMTLKITAKENAKSDTVIFDCIEDAIKTTTHPSGALYVAKNSSGNPEVDSKGEVIDDARISSAYAEIQVVAEEETPNTIKVKEDFDFADDVVIDTDVIGLYLEWYEGDYDDAVDATATGLIYGADVFEYTLEEVLTTELGDDFIVFTRTEEADGYDSTGTKIEVLAADGKTVIETYYYVYFGDVNNDGYIDSSDVSLSFDALETGDPFDSIAQFIAADYNADTYFDTSDVSDLFNALESGDEFNQGELAAAFYEAIQDSI